VTPSPVEPSELAGVYAGHCDAGEGTLELRDDGSFHLSLVAAEGGTQWTIEGRWLGFAEIHEFDAAPFAGTIRYCFGLWCEKWNLRWSTTPGLTSADLWPPFTEPYGPVHCVTSEGLVVLHAWEYFALPRRAHGAPSKA
jgi:hypothetical protein